MQDLAPLRTEFLQVNYAKAADLARADQVAGRRARCCPSAAASRSTSAPTRCCAGHGGRLEDIRRLVGDARHPGPPGADRGAHRDRQRRLQPRPRRARRLHGASPTTSGNDGLAHAARRWRTTPILGLRRSTTSAEHRRQPFAGRRCRPARPPTRYNVNLPVANPAGSLALTCSARRLPRRPRALGAQAEGRGEIISTPRVITANQREASIEQGVEIPYQESASSGRHDDRSSRRRCWRSR